MQKKLLHLLVLLLVLSSSSAWAQPITLTTTGTGYTAGYAWANGYIAFAVTNNNTYDIKLMEVSTWYDVSNSGGTFTLWATSNAAQLSGQPNITTAAGWSQVGTSAPITATTAAITPVLTGLNFIIPANTTYRFAFTVSVGSIYYAGTGTPAIFSGGGVDLVGHQNGVTTGGDFPNATPNYFNPRAFIGAIKFDRAFEKCQGIPKIGAIVASDTSMCPNKGYDYTLFNSSHSVNTQDTAGYTWYWETSIDGAVWSLVPGSIEKDTIKGIFTDDVWYRMYMICTFSNDTMRTNTVHIRKKDANKCYCYSQTTGTESDSSDIGALTIYKFNVNLGGPHLLNPIAVKRRTDYTDLDPIEMYIDSSYKFEIKHIMKGNFHNNAKVTIFMDYNHNQKYDLPHEKVYEGLTGPTSFVLTPVITIPDSAIEKYPTGMRIILNDDAGPNGASDSACGSYISGETEDYMVLFQRAFPTGINNMSQLSGLSLYPNPATDLFTIRFSSKSGVDMDKVNLSIYNFTGQVVLKDSYAGVGTSFYKEITTDGWAKGVYLVELNVGGEKIIRKLVLR